VDQCGVQIISPADALCLSREADFCAGMQSDAGEWQTS